MRVNLSPLYLFYNFEDLNKITSAETPLKLSKKLFLKQNTDTGKELTEITENSNLKVGDLITVRIELQSDSISNLIHEDQLSIDQLNIRKHEETRAIDHFDHHELYLFFANYQLKTKGATD